MKIQQYFFCGKSNQIFENLCKDILNGRLVLQIKRYTPIQDKRLLATISDIYVRGEKENMSKNTVSVVVASNSFFSNLSELDKLLALWALSLGYMPVIGLMLMTIGK